MDAPPIEPTSAETATAPGGHQPDPESGSGRANGWVPRRLSSSQRGRLIEALVDAFDHGGMERLADVGLGVFLGQIVSPQQPLPEIARKLVERAEAQGQLADLDSAAKELNPGNPRLRSWLPGPQFVRDTPYRGLLAFREIDADVFFGRDAVAEQLAEAVAQRRVVAVIGPSGSGKSSVVFAGLVPRLQATGAWVIASFRPGDNPVEALSASLVPVLEPDMSEIDRLTERSKLAKALREGMVKLDDVLLRIREKHDAATYLILIADQFEEVFTLTRDPAARRAFLDMLLPAFSQPVEIPGQPPTSVLVPTLRADYLSQALSYPPLVHALQGADLKLGPMSREELRQAVERPAALRGVALEAGLSERILEDVGEEPGNLPLLEFALTRLWEEQETGLLTHTAYEAIGEVDGALATHAEEVVSRISGDPERLRQIFTQLVRPGEGTADTRRRASRREIGEEGWALVTQLATEKLVVTDHDERTGHDTVEVAHEALIREWPTLQRWMDQDRDFRRWQEDLRHDLDIWEEMGHDPGALLRGTRLAVAEDWVHRREPEVLEAEQRFIAASVAAREEARNAERSMRWRLVTSLAGGLIAALILTALFVWQWWRAGEQATRAEDQAAVARTQARANLIQALSAEAMNQGERGEDELGALLARQAYLFEVEANTPISRQVDAALRQTLRAQRFRRSDLRGHLGVIRSVAFSPAGDQVVSSDQEGAVLLRDPNNPSATPFSLGDYDGQVLAVGFAPGGDTLAVGRHDGSILVFDPDAPTIAPIMRRGDGTAVTALVFASDNLLAAASANGIIRLWDLDQDDADPLTLAGHQGLVRALAFDPADNRLASAGENGIIHLWDLEPYGVVGATLKRHEESVRSLAFTPNGDRLASGDEGGTILIWNPDQPRDPLVTVKDQEGRVNAVAFAPGGNLLASAGEDGTIRLRDSNALTNEPLTIEVNPDNPAEIWTLAFVPGRDVLAAAGADQLIHLWNLDEAGATPQIVQEEAGEVHGMAFLQPDKRLAVGSVDGTVGTVRLWDLTQPGVEPKVLRGNAGMIQDLAFAPTRNWLASGSAGGPLLLWDLNEPDPEPRALIVPEPEKDFQAFSVAFSPTGDWLASGSADGRIWRWDLNRLGAPPLPLTGHSGWVGSVAFDPVSNRLASAGQDGVILLWDIEKPGMPATSLGTHGKQIQTVAFAPTGDLVASAGFDGSIRLWNPDQPEVAVSTLLGWANPVLSLAFAPTGDWLASGSADGTVRMWNFRRPEDDPIVLGSHEQEAFAVSFAPDGETLVSGGRDQVVRMWTVNTSTLADLVCKRVWRNLTEEEWSNHVGAEIPRESTCPGLPPSVENEGPGVALVHDMASSAYYGGL